MIVYFTGTGNSRWCAELLADRLDDEVLDVFHYIKNGIAADLRSGKPWVFVSPTYAWQLPHIFADFLRTSGFSGSTDAYFVMTCGSDIGNAPEKNRILCEEIGLTCRGTLEVVMPENYIAMFGTPGEEEAAEIRKKAEKFLLDNFHYILENQSFPEVRAGAADRLKSGFVNRTFYRLFVKASPFAVSDQCISCGKCAESCVLGNIEMKDGRPVWGDRCTHCMACISGCPVSAIEYGRKSRGKTRYLCPDYHTGN